MLRHSCRHKGCNFTVFLWEYQYIAPYNQCWFLLLINTYLFIKSLLLLKGKYIVLFCFFAWLKLLCTLFSSVMNNSTHLHLWKHEWLNQCCGLHCHAFNSQSKCIFELFWLIIAAGFFRRGGLTNETDWARLWEGEKGMGCYNESLLKVLTALSWVRRSPKCPKLKN